MKKIILKKKRQSGNHRSHALNAKRRTWKGNKQTGYIYLKGKKVKIIGTTREIRSLRKQLLASS